MNDIAIAIFHGLGDCVNSTTLLKPIKEYYKTTEITWITSEKYAPVVQNNPLISKVEIIAGDVWQADSKYNELAIKYKKLIQPAPYRNRPSKNNTLLESYKERIKNITKSDPKKFEPLLYMTDDEKLTVNNWLNNNNISNYIMMETNFTSSQSYWNENYTLETLKILGDKGYTVLLTHKSDSNIETYNKICKTYCLDFNFRLMPEFYNNSSGFIGVSSGISCITHTQSCKKDLPHLEFVKGKHWATKEYHKENKIINYNDNINYCIGLINSLL